MSDNKRIKPTFEEIKKAKYHPNGWVYRVSGEYDAEGAIPPEAIVGAWKVDSSGEIEGDFISNPNYQLERAEPN